MCYSEILNVTDQRTCVRAKFCWLCAKFSDLFTEALKKTCRVFFTRFRFTFQSFSAISCAKLYTFSHVRSGNGGHFSSHYSYTCSHILNTCSYWATFIKLEKSPDEEHIANHTAKSWGYFVERWELDQKATKSKISLCFVRDADNPFRADPMRDETRPLAHSCHYTLHTEYCTLHTAYHTLHTAHWTLHTEH